MNLLERHFEIAIGTPDGIKKLRELILKLAMQGKLVQQSNSEISIKDYLDNKNINRKIDKKAIDINLIKKPFLIPTSWEWFRLGDIGETNIGLTYAPKDISEKGIIVLRSSNVQGGKIELSDLIRVDKKINPKLIVNDADILICARNGSKALVGKAAIIKELPEVMTFGAFMAIYRTEFYNYVYQFLQSPIFRSSLENVSTTTINQITQNDLKNTIIPLPPIEEQKRIIEKIEQLMSLCDELEKQRNIKNELLSKLNSSAINKLVKAEDENSLNEAWTFIHSQFDILYTEKDNVSNLRKIILELAIRGKLTVNESKNTSAKNLLKSLQFEKEELIRNRVIKKEKELPDISTDEIPFELPSNWIWTRLGDLCSKIGSGSTPRGGKSVYQIEGVKFIRSQNVHNAGLRFDNVAFIDKETHLKMSNTKVISNDILLNITGGSIGRCTLVPKYFDEANVSQHVSIIRPFKGLENQFIHQYILSPYFQNKIMEVQTGGNREGLAKKNMQLMLVPLPPINEQIAIVQTVSKLLFQCDLLESHILESSKKQDQIFNSVLANI